MARALLVRVTFPGGVYRGAELRRPEAIPSPARLHAAFVSAAAGGPSARADGGVLVAEDPDREAVAWLEENAPLAIVPPEVEATEYTAVRHRVRTAVDPKSSHDLHRDETPFEPFSAVSGSILYAWPAAPPAIRDRLAATAREITHIGQADATVLVEVTEDEVDLEADGTLRRSRGRGPGRELRIPTAGRWDALVGAHRRACTGDRQRHRAGAMNTQAKDERVQSAGETATQLVRFAAQRPSTPWPYAEAWTVPMFPPPPHWATRPRVRVRSAVAVHRALVAAIGDDVPAFVTGRDGDGPLSGAGHLAIQFVRSTSHAVPSLVLGVPDGLEAADRARLLDALERRPVVRFGDVRAGLRAPRIGSAVAFWRTPAQVMASAVPLVLDTPGTPRRTPWSLDDAVLCSVGYALRGALEADGVEWGTGWDFRRELVGQLRARGVEARAFRVPAPASWFAHRGRQGDLLVAVHATVKLGSLGFGDQALLALGRARHLGGGLLVPLAEQ